MKHKSTFDHDNLDHHFNFDYQMMTMICVSNLSRFLNQNLLRLMHASPCTKQFS